MRRRRNNTLQMMLKVIRMISILLLGFILVITAQGDSSSSSVATVSGLDSNQNKLEVTGIADMHQKEPKFERSGIANMRKLWLGAKKKLIKHEEDMESKNEREGISTTTEEISGNVQYGLKSSFGSLGKQKKDQKKHMIMESKASRFTKFVIPRRSSGPTNKNTNTKCSSQDYCNDVAINNNERRMKSSSSSSKNSEEAQQQEGGTSHHHQQSSLVEAEKEVANLIYKDYKGKPSHKPPINNNEPGN